MMLNNHLKNLKVKYNKHRSITTDEQTRMNLIIGGAYLKPEKY